MGNDGTTAIQRVQEAVERATPGHNTFSSWGGSNGAFTVRFSRADLDDVLRSHEALCEALELALDAMVRADCGTVTVVPKLRAALSLARGERK